MHIGTLVRLPLGTASPLPPPALTSLMREALTRVVTLLKDSTWDTNTYTQAMTFLDALATVEKRRSGMDVDGKTSSAAESEMADINWVDKSTDSEKRELAKLDVELRGYMSNLIKESIRVSPRSFAIFLDVLKCIRFRTLTTVDLSRLCGTRPQSWFGSISYEELFRR